MKTLIFWQYALSIHQSAFTKNIAKTHKVMLLVNKDFSENRKDLGWIAPDFGNVEVRVAPSKSEVEQVFRSHPEAIHVFGGIDAFPFVFEAFKLAVGLKSRILVYLETVNLEGFKGQLRFIKYTLLFRKYEKHIRGILATGLTAKRSFIKLGFPEAKIYDWGYFTEEPDNVLDFGQENKNKPSYLYVGALIKRKNIVPIIKTVCKFSEKVERFTVLGGGPLENEVKALLEPVGNFHFSGSVSNTEVFGLMKTHDYLILPSYFDGWGAVVNEALMSGMKVLVSNRCGASVLVAKNEAGLVFDPFFPESFESVFRKSLQDGPLENESRVAIQNWAVSTISGPVVSMYFEKIIEHIFEGSEDLTEAPWL
ncbi:glycosyltransferase family 4 protein [Litoribacter ruber]|uniref:Glycosyltransferase family 4 protein n=1 Tax=Litoribacter ruber TaxID=702568 RepID=A0AAP2G378_9BACT|nr:MULTISPECIES: glycosyltransferase family 4 protein [Litoribacter]MBS9523190.1 glycosyltransferase family 4 protein [Litoribacter alkaliphilus]MBT0810647.1 glycosyltransferase family 4 protein [Litoribacter ruber]